MEDEKNCRILELQTRIDGMEVRSNIFFYLFCKFYILNIKFLVVVNFFTETDIKIFWFISFVIAN